MELFEYNKNQHGIKHVIDLIVDEYGFTLLHIGDLINRGRDTIDQMRRELLTIANSSYEKIVDFANNLIMVDNELKNRKTKLTHVDLVHYLSIFYTNDQISLELGLTESAISKWIHHINGIRPANFANLVELFRKHFKHGTIVVPKYCRKTRTDITESTKKLVDELCDRGYDVLIRKKSKRRIYKFSATIK